MRVVPCLIVMACLALLPGGCAQLGKRSEGERAPKSDSPPAKAPAKFPGGGDSRPAPNSHKDPILDSTAGATDSGVILAGRVRDSFNHVPANIFVRWTCVDHGKESEPADVAVSADGYFTIAGLKRGAQYKLVGRAKQGDRVLAGISYTAAPNIRIVIRLSEDFANAAVPDVPGPPVYQKPKSNPAPKSKEEPKKTAMMGPERPISSWTPAPSKPPSIRIGIPRPETEQPAAPQPPARATPGHGGFLPGIADDGRPWPPTVDIPGPHRQVPALPLQIRRPTPLTNPDIPAPPPIAVPPPPLAPPASLHTPGNASTRVPSCILVGKHLVNFALYDLHGQAWEFRSQRRGKLVLLDFWGTHCKPCLASIPSLRQLHTSYSQTGLEIIGIACEGDDDRQEQAQRVTTFCQRHQVPYRQLLGGGQRCPVRTDFGVQGIPTLVLLDDHGWILWRHLGLLDAASLEELELIIKRRLGIH